MVLVGGYWFWFFIRVDVAAEGKSPFRVMQADLFILSLLASVTLGLIWAWLQARGSGAAIVFSPCTSSPRRCCSDPCHGPSSHTCSSSRRRRSKKVSYANGTRSNLPGPADKPEQFGGARTAPRHY